MFETGRWGSKVGTTFAPKVVFPKLRFPIIGGRGVRLLWLGNLMCASRVRERPVGVA